MHVNISQFDLNNILSLTLNCISIIISRGGVLSNTHSELLPEQTKRGGYNCGSIESHRAAHAHPMAMM